MITAEAINVETNRTSVAGPKRVGRFQLFGDSLTKFYENCVNTVSEADDLRKTEVQVSESFLIPCFVVLVSSLNWLTDKKLLLHSKAKVIDNSCSIQHNHLWKTRVLRTLLQTFRLYSSSPVAWRSAYVQISQLTKNSRLPPVIVCLIKEWKFVFITTRLRKNFLQAHKELVYNLFGLGSEKIISNDDKFSAR